MGVHDGLHISTRTVDAGVQVELQRRLAGRSALHLALHVDGADVADRQAAALATAAVDEHLAAGQADAGVAVVVDDVRGFQHADAVDELLLQFKGVVQAGSSRLRGVHQPTCSRNWARHRSQARRPAAWLTWSAKRPSSSFRPASGSPAANAAAQCWMRALTSV